MYKRHPYRYKIAGLLLFLLFTQYWCSITLFAHSHMVNGVVIVHSHPYKAEHAHTQAQFETILYLSLFQTPGDIHPGFELRLWLIPLCSIASFCLYALPLRPVSDNNTRDPPFS